MKSKKATSLAWAYLRHKKLQLTNAVFWRSLYELVPMQVPLLTGLIVDGLAGGQMSIWGVETILTTPIMVLQFAVAGLVGVAILYGLSAYGWTVATAKLSRGFVTSLRRRLISHTINLSLDKHHSIGSAGIMDRVLTDAAATRSFLEKVFVRTITNVLRAGYPLVMLMLINFRLALIALAVLPIQRIISWKLERRLQESTRERRNSDANFLASLKENLDGIEDIQTLNVNEMATRTLNCRADHLENRQLRVARLTALMRLTVWTSTGIGLAFTWWVGGGLVMSGQMSIGTLVVFTGLVTFAYRPFRQFTNIINVYHRGVVSLERVHKLLSVKSSVKDCSNAEPLIIKKACVTLNEVSFAYGTQKVLNNINLKIKANQIVAVVGPSGSGKSTLLKLLTRIYDPQQGQVCIGKQPLNLVTLASLRSQVAKVGQHPILFNDTVLENIRLAHPDAGLETVKAASRFAGAEDFIEKLNDGYSTFIGTDGIKMSGGQAQRIALARALLAKPSLLLLDEPTSALDTKTETKIVRMLTQLKEQTTVVLTTHREQVMRNADLIVVLDRGKVVDTGKHLALRERCDVYRELLGKNKIIALAA